MTMKSVYEEIGGEKLTMIVNQFYTNVSNHPELSKIFPSDLTETKRKQTQFLTQYFGGPSLYSDEHGHPMLRYRHLRFPITEDLAKAWLACMEDALDQYEIQPELKKFVLSRLELTALHMVNTPIND